eukprot:CAMPEP_0194706146 /NCGR_PEP_ID=MMETSP0295-20121207/29390_1 /TAXON_ID=39354 /ORGANISM="Heterosigma akashiwo, Strain CCMP2393" /LENGTH=265 /DNA_ID=CAMNT_0039602037 /DNA_START=453 /DNA_END=1250 /DNA_ORIENTATION=+
MDPVIKYRHCSIQYPLCALSKRSLQHSIFQTIKPVPQLAVEVGPAGGQARGADGELVAPRRAGHHRQPRALHGPARRGGGGAGGHHPEIVANQVVQRPQVLDPFQLPRLRRAKVALLHHELLHERKSHVIIRIVANYMQLAIDHWSLKAKAFLKGLRRELINPPHRVLWFRNLAVPNSNVCEITPTYTMAPHTYTAAIAAAAAAARRRRGRGRRGGGAAVGAPGVRGARPAPDPPARREIQWPRSAWIVWKAGGGLYCANHGQQN